MRPIHIYIYIYTCMKRVRETRDEMTGKKVIHKNRRRNTGEIKKRKAHTYIGQNQVGLSLLRLFTNGVVAVRIPAILNGCRCRRCRCRGCGRCGAAAMINCTDQARVTANTETAHTAPEPRRRRLRGERRGGKVRWRQRRRRGGEAMPREGILPLLLMLGVRMVLLTAAEAVTAAAAVAVLTVVLVLLLLLLVLLTRVWC